jgi:hypothetical protein
MMALRENGQLLGYPLWGYSSAEPHSASTGHVSV